MARVVESVAPDYGDALDWKKVITKEMEGALRLGELSQKLGRPAPVPSIFIDSELIFETTPGPDELRECLNQYIRPRK
ncbi:MAG: hypothetical protein QNI92_13370 [Desulfobacterales bacterium]|nr:hypothetical protein [Desulfobacterales bacterium]